VTTTVYDALDRPTQTSIGGLVATSRYDAGGRLVERGDATGITTFDCDTRNQLVAEHLPGGATNVYSYDAVGNLTSMTDVAGTVSYAYNAVNLATFVVEPGGAVTTFAYDNDDNRTLTSYPNGVTQAAAYDTSSRLKAIKGKRGTTTLTRFAYTYTMAGAGARRCCWGPRCRSRSCTRSSYRRPGRMCRPSRRKRCLEPELR
jgi:YD repeat-containing protein